MVKLQPASPGRGFPYVGIREIVIFYLKGMDSSWPGFIYHMPGSSKGASDVFLLSFEYVRFHRVRRNFIAEIEEVTNS